MADPTPAERARWRAEQHAAECRAVLGGVARLVQLVAEGVPPDLARAMVEAAIDAQRSAILSQPPPWVEQRESVVVRRR